MKMIMQFKMTTRKRSMKALEEYKTAINNYLKSKNINNYYKYKI